MKKILVTDRTILNKVAVFKSIEVIMLTFKDIAIVAEDENIELLKIDMNRREFEELSRNRRELLKKLDDIALMLENIDLAIVFLNEPLANIVIPLYDIGVLRGTLSYMFYDVKDLIDSRNLYALLKELTYYTFNRNGYMVVLDYDKIRDTNIYDIVFDAMINGRIGENTLKDLLFIGVAIKRVKNREYYKSILSNINEITKKMDENEIKIKELKNYADRIKLFLEKGGTEYTILVDNNSNLIVKSKEVYVEKKLASISLPIDKITHIITYSSRNMADSLKESLGVEVYSIPTGLGGDSVIFLGFGRLMKLEEDVFTRNIKTKKPLDNVGETYITTPLETLKQVHYERIRNVEFIRAIPIFGYDCSLLDVSQRDSIVGKIHQLSTSINVVASAISIDLNNIRDIVDALMNIYSINVKGLFSVMDSILYKCKNIPPDMKSSLLEIIHRIPDERSLRLRIFQLLDELSNIMFLVEETGDKEYSDKIRRLSEANIEDFLENLRALRENVGKFLEKLE